MAHVELGPSEQHAAARLIDLALAEDLGFGSAPGQGATLDLSAVFSVSTTDSLLDNLPDLPASDLDRDLTCAALIDPGTTASIDVVARRPGVLSGSSIGMLVFDRLDDSVRWDAVVADGSPVEPQTVIARVSGPLRSLLIGERTVLNFMQHLSGVATLTRQFVDAVRSTRAVILDTRKTLPGWRVLDKYAVRCGGAANHRMGLFDGVLIKDNHLASWRVHQPQSTIADVVKQTRDRSPVGISIEVEVDTLDQLRDALAGSPDIVLLDNMSLEHLREAVSLRDRLAPAVRLEASGGVTLETVRGIAETGVDRISIGALTHSAPALDIAFDWPA